MQASPISRHLGLEKYANLKGTIMKSRKVSETRMVSILRQHEAGRTVRKICRDRGISDALVDGRRLRL